MGLVRDIGMTLPAMEERALLTCSYLNTCSTALPYVWTATADMLVTSGAPVVNNAFSSLYTSAAGRVIDRTAPPLGTLYNVAMPAAVINSTRGSTEANRSIMLGIKLQHGDSSAGGDMADYSTNNQPADRQYFSTGRTTDMLSWELSGRSTGAFQGATNPAYYDLRGAKRFIRTIVRACLPGRTPTTESTAEEGSRVAAEIVFLAGEQLPQLIDSRFSPISSATSTI